MKQESISIKIIGRLASFLSVLMYVSYIPQIFANLNGSYGNPIQPLVAGINCTVWTYYGLFKANRDWPIVIANLPGIVLGFFTFFTALH
ncbi:SemiSWEET family transporter [Pediococcus claussenii]|uniref:Conserved membrane protein n=1 Tax=Pediococcus claussenii (strain ATCC BAA-344 / DSM 14800 / JCM 18046 / KCTC 3811 / LMG 21948 / P06) TaxID=701521 RepID=G8PDK4_PEDCP|nr:SemiSWEET family transporter [Pediococcus claussenii]AEV95339.1 conserved membrane protein [Pediococcus claussenii ATCC BAA-344]ANZ68871.1 hypothetical protein AYR57_00400 [Pediococcus claussenii]ANZ70687.1 hypothetical protein AYR58_00400 [Pediococcus claussenii]KRN19479.1 hypothetical protein IV79_GL001196 [Pediococcus claussenii]